MWPFNKKENKFVKKVTITKCTLHSDIDETQYHVKVNGKHVIGGCVKTLEEAIKVHDRYCNSKYGTMETELIKETLI